MKPAIQVECLGKRYEIGGPVRHGSFRDRLGSLLTRAKSSPTGEARRSFWAVKDVSFDVQQGEVLGVIGRNGAGKSTLLKILSRITEPTTGIAQIRGRVGSLLEVGTGFHPDLTGRENVFLNGAILGMTRAEIARKLDAIVDFAELAEFLETPVKHYSSGMYMRLAFAVAAHLEPEILLVDEVLAVGDAAFQKKCLGRMGELAQAGRTVLFVSHNLGAVTSLTHRAIFLAGGRLEQVGPPAEVVAAYLRSSGASQASRGTSTRQGKRVNLHRCWVSQAERRDTQLLAVNEPWSLCLEIEVETAIEGLEVSLAVVDRHGRRLFILNASECVDVPSRWGSGRHRLRVDFPAHLLAPGPFSIDVWLHRPHIELYEYGEGCAHVDIQETGSRLFKYRNADVGSLLLSLPWDYEPPQTVTAEDGC